MKNQLLSLFLILSAVSFAQNKETFLFNKDTISNYVVTEVPGKTKSELFAAAKNWLATYYKNPSEVLKSEVADNYIRIEGASDTLLCFQALGSKNCYPATYQIEFAFQDGRYRMEIIELLLVGTGSDPNTELSDPSEYYKKDGKIKGNFRYFPELIPAYFNTINSNLKEFIVTGGQSPKKKW